MLHDIVPHRIVFIDATDGILALKTFVGHQMKFALAGTGDAALGHASSLRPILAET